MTKVRLAAAGASKEAMRQASFEQIRKDLGGVWIGTKGETYEVLLGEASSLNQTWPCVRKNENGSMTYTLKWDGEDSVIWGTDYCLLLSELRRSGGRPTWHSAKGKRPFVWFRGKGEGEAAGGSSAKDKPPCPSEHVKRPPTVSLALGSRLAAIAAGRSEEDATDKVSPSNTSSTVDCASAKSSGHATGSCPERGPAGRPVATELEDPSAAGAAAAALLRRLRDSNAVPTEFSDAVTAAAAMVPERAVDGDGGLEAKVGQSKRPPPPSMSPDEAELKNPLELLLTAGGAGGRHHPAPPGADDTDAEVEEAAQRLPLGSQVRALWFDDWHYGTVRRICEDMVEVLWDSEYSMSYVPMQDVELRYPWHTAVGPPKGSIQETAASVPEGEGEEDQDEEEDASNEQGDGQAWSLWGPPVCTQKAIQKPGL